MIQSLEMELTRLERRGDIVEAIRVDPSLAPPVLRRQSAGPLSTRNSAFDEYNVYYNNQNNRSQ